MEFDEESLEYVTVSTPTGYVRFGRMPQGIKTAPSDFQETMEDMLNDMPFAGPFLDDILIASRTVSEHMQHLRRVLARIMEWGFKLNPKKCKFFCSSVRFLGKIVDASGIRPDPEKVRAIQDMPEPTDVSSLRSFLGMVNYYQSFIPSFRDLREPLDDLLKKDMEWTWSSKQKQSVIKIKQQLVKECLLTHYDPRLPIIVAADASQAGIGGVISHRYPDGTEKPIQFFSRALDATQRKYSQTEKEGLALVMAIKTFHRYLEGRKFTLLTDHKALLSIFGNKKLMPVLAANRLHRWAIFLAGYRFDIQYRRTTEFGQADAVSRLIAETRSIPELFEEELDLDDAVATQTLIKHVELLPVTSEDITKAYETDEFAQEVRRSFCNGSTDTRFSEVKGVIMMQNRVYIPAALRARVLDQLHAGHHGITATKQLARQHVYWPNITKDIENMVKCCLSCIQVTKMPVKTHLSSWPRSMNPGDRVHIDFAGPLLDHMLLVIVDSYSKWIEVAVLKTASTKTTLGVLSKYMADNGAPRVLVSDNGRQFVSEEFETFCRSHGIKHICSPAYHPQSNGQAERSVDIVKRFVKKCATRHGPNMDLEACIHAFLLAYRTTPSTATPGGVTPAMAHVGRELRTNLDLLRPQVVKTLGPDEEMEKQFHDQYGTKARSFQVHDLVYARKGKDNPWFDGTVIGIFGSCMYNVRDARGKTHRMHANQLIKRYLPVLSHEYTVADDDTATTPVHQQEVNTPPRRSCSSSNATAATPPPTRSPAAEQRTSPRAQPTPRRVQPTQPRRSSRTRNAPDRLNVNPAKKSYN
uniref:Integrase catalytic domain-containing protein n=1 Tax=Panagrolaimus sp. ES5 TaxID=591445 RepID=A0AC34EZC1_9BILA